jgi:hypothetical protein
LKATTQVPGAVNVTLPEDIEQPVDPPLRVFTTASPEVAVALGV